MLQFSRVSLNLVLLAAALIIVQPVPFTVYLPPQITTKTSTISVGQDSLTLGNENAPSTTADSLPIISSDSNTVNTDDEFNSPFFNKLASIQSPPLPPPIEVPQPVAEPPPPQQQKEMVEGEEESSLTREANQVLNKLDAPHGIGEAYPEHQRFLPGESYVEDIKPEEFDHSLSAPVEAPPVEKKKPCNKKPPLTVVRMLDTLRMFLNPDYEDEVCVDLYPSRNCYYGTALPDEAIRAIKIIERKPELFGNYFEVKSTVFDPNGIRRHLPFFDEGANQWLLYLGPGCEHTGSDNGMCLRVMIQSSTKA